MKFLLGALVIALALGGAAWTIQHLDLFSVAAVVVVLVAVGAIVGAAILLFDLAKGVLGE